MSNKKPVVWTESSVRTAGFLLWLGCAALLWGCGCDSKELVGDEEIEGEETHPEGPEGDIPHDPAGEDIGGEPDTEANPPSCPADSASPNQSQAEAYILTEEGYLEGLVVCAGVDDWFTLVLPYGMEMQADACRAVGNPAVTLDFFREEFPDPSLHMGGGSSSSTEVCEGTAIWEAPGTYFYRVSTAHDQAPYRLHLHLGSWYRWPCTGEGTACDSTHVCLGGVCTCSVDEIEPNNDATEARAVDDDRSYDLVACVEDADWFRVEADAGDALSVNLETSPVIGEGYFMSLTVYGEDDTEEALGFYPKAHSSETFTFNVPETGAYLLEVLNTHSYGMNYSLEVTR